MAQSRQMSRVVVVVVVERGGRAEGQGKETIALLCVDAFMIMKVEPGWPRRPVLDTKIILNKSGTVGACLVLRQRVCVTAPLFTKMPNCISLATG